MWLSSTKQVAKDGVFIMNQNNRDGDFNLRECLALERTTLANERTFLSYARTAVMVFITGITAFKLFQDNSIIFILGWFAILVSTILFFVGLKKYTRRFRSLSTMESNCSTHHK
jgi:putative membrane protein